VNVGLLFENANATSLDKKWCATSMLPICTPLQVPSLKTKSSCAKIVPMGRLIHRHDPSKYREQRV